MYAALPRLTLGDFTAGFAQLLGDGVIGITEIVEAMHRDIVLRPLGLQNHATPLWEYTLTRQIYKIIFSIMQISTTGARWGARGLGWLLAKQPALQNQPLPDSIQLLVSALNGAFGDHLTASKNPIALDMNIVAELPANTRTVLVFVHGLGINGQSWRPDDSEGFGAQLEGFLPNTASAYVTYNTGQHISTNGRNLALELESLWNIHPNARFVLIGHSMGGLVSRSALHYAEKLNLHWLKNTDKLVCLGSPHHGAILEKMGHFAVRNLGEVPYAGVLARLGMARSAGVKDLRYGNLLDSDWENNADSEGVPNDQRTPVPLPAKVRCYFGGATLEKAYEPNLLLNIIGDLLVRVPSATGYHADPLKNVGVPLENTHIWCDMNHFELQYSPIVLEKLKTWLS